MPRSALPDYWKDKTHTDWPWPFKWVPRAWTSFNTGIFGKPPKKLLGNGWMGELDGVAFPKPVPKPGQWLIAWPPYVAFTTKGGWHVRAGCRYDDLDLYYTVPTFANKQIAEYKK